MTTPTLTPTQAPTYAYIGGRARVGYQQHGKLFNHYDIRRGRFHALNKTGYRSYTAVCGVAVGEESTDNFDQGGENPIEIAIGATSRVTCKACLRRKPVAVERPKRTVYVVMLEMRTGEQVRWSSDADRSRSERYAANIMTDGTASITHQPGDVVRAWVEEGQEYVS